MILRGIQRRLLKTLADVDDLSGYVNLEDKGDYYDVVGWKETFSEPKDICFKISAGEVKELVENRCVRHAPNGDVAITAVGRELLKR